MKNLLNEIHSSKHFDLRSTCKLVIAYLYLSCNVV